MSRRRLEKRVKFVSFDFIYFVITHFNYFYLFSFANCKGVGPKKQ